VFKLNEISMQLSDLDLTKTYTYADYYSWDFEERVELINGIVFPMGESPGTLHQRVLGNLFFSCGCFSSRPRSRSLLWTL
jgi:hypothetical protein